MNKIMRQILRMLCYATFGMACFVGLMALGKYAIFISDHNFFAACAFTLVGMAMVLFFIIMGFLVMGLVEMSFGKEGSKTYEFFVDILRNYL